MAGGGCPTQADGPSLEAQPEANSVVTDNSDHERTTSSVEFVDADGDTIEFVFVENPDDQEASSPWVVQQRLNGKLEVRRVRYFHICKAENKFKDVGGFGYFREGFRDDDIARLTAFFQDKGELVDFRVEDPSSSGRDNTGEMSSL
eukprot:TRINITY_DN19620_c0_g1_i1.p2 TRINITY_DN19620_c0_g1~~TRINITY_DN19620_c0_g1_i1.p2  ORF type:complete len:159 (-),score=21.47 TRINITY_DN19620_c0_g1_i1:11-448(-)